MNNCPSFLMLEWHVRPIHLLFNRHCFILSDCVSRRVTRTGIRRKKIPENAFGACGNDLFVLYLHPQTAPRELSSAGSERLPYKQRVGGSNPSAPTTMSATYSDASGFFFDKREHSSVGLERLLDKQEVSGSNPLVPTIFERPARLRVVFCTRLRIPVSPCVRPKDPRKRTVEKWNWDL